MVDDDIVVLEPARTQPRSGFRVKNANWRSIGLSPKHAHRIDALGQ